MAGRPKATILDHFADLDDPRVERIRRHKLMDIIAIAMSRASAKRTTVVSLFRTNVRLSVQRQCHSVTPRWYQMMMPWEPPGIVALEDPRPPGIS